MAEKRENSVLFSLRELRQIEDDRVKQEDAEAKARDEAARQARADAERRAREDAERMVREASDAERRVKESAERQVREDQLRLEEAERRARIEAQTRLEEHRLKVEIEAQTIHGAKKKHRTIIITATVMGLIVLGLGAFIYMKKKESDERAERAAAATAAKEERERFERETNAWKVEVEATVEELKRIDDDNQQLLAQLQKTQDAAEASRIRNRMEENTRKRVDAEKRRQDLEKKKPVVRKKCDDPNDPLCGL